MSEKTTSPNQVQEAIIALTKATDTCITDIHIEQDEEIKVRGPAGWIFRKEFAPSTHEEMASIFTNFFGANYLAELQSSGSVSTSTQFAESRLRITGYTVREGKRLVLSIRLHPMEPKKLEDLKLPMDIQKAIRLSNRGLLIVTGPTRSAKTTTLAAIVDFYNKSSFVAGSNSKVTRNLHVVTIEDPVEYVHARENAIITSKSVGVDTPSYAAGLQDALRQSPDVIMIGEVRDADTAKTMLLAADSGHLVLATMHTNNAASVINKVLSFFPEDEHKMILNSLSSNLIGVLCQSMISNVAGDELIIATEHFMNYGAKLAEAIQAGNASAIQAIMKNAGFGNSTEGCSHLNAQLADLVKKNSVSLDSALRGSYNPQELMTMTRAK